MDHLTKERLTQAKSYLAPLGTISSRSQFGGYSIMADNVMFAVISEGELYLRADDRSEPRFIARGMINFIYTKRGIPVVLRYYLVDVALWQNLSALIIFARLSLEGARADTQQRSDKGHRLKDLPNMGVKLERLLWRAGIRDAGELRQQGPKGSFLKLRALRSSMGLNVLLALAGAINGYHCAVLPDGIRTELTQWFEENEAHFRIMFSKI